MATRSPLVLGSNGIPQRLQSGDLLPATAIPFSGVISSTTFASLPAANSVRTYLDIYFVIDVGVQGSFWYSNGTNWFPLNGSVLAYNLPSDRTSNGSVTEAIQAQFIIPGGVLKAGWCINCKIRGNKNSNNQTHNFRLRLGTTGTIADTVIYSLPSVMLASNSQIFYFWDFTISDATHIRTNMTDANASGDPTIGNPVASLSPVVIANISNLLYLSFSSWATVATETFTTQRFEVSILCR